MGASEQETAHKKKLFLQAYEKSLCNKTQARKSLEKQGVKIGYRTIYNWRDEDADFKKEMDMIDTIELDFADSKLKEAVGKGNITAIIYFLKCKGKELGYVETQNVDLSGSLRVENWKAKFK